MVRKTVVLADGDEAYLERLSNYFMEKAPQLELALFTDQEMMDRYLGENRPDILLVGEEFAGKAKEAKAAVRLVLSSSMAPAEGFEVIKKYQKTEKLLSEILLKYAEATGTGETLKGSSHTRTAAFYSPAGGGGKSVLALGMACACARAGLRTLYLNLEEIDSVQGLLPPAPGSMSDLFLALKTKGMNVGIKLAACVGEEPVNGFWYVSGVDSISEYEEISGEEMERLLEAVKDQAEYDILIADLSSGFHERTLSVLRQSDIIFVPIPIGEGPRAKMNRLLGEARFHERYNSLFERMRLVINQADSREAAARTAESLGSLACTAVLPKTPVLAEKALLLQAGAQLDSIFEPFIRQMRQDS